MKCFLKVLYMRISYLGNPSRLKDDLSLLFQQEPGQIILWK